MKKMTKEEILSEIEDIENTLLNADFNSENITLEITLEASDGATSAYDTAEIERIDPDEVRNFLNEQGARLSELFTALESMEEEDSDDSDLEEIKVELSSALSRLESYDFNKPTDARTPSKPETVSEVLDIIDQFLVDHMSDGKAETLWNILSALRGPDADVVGVAAAKACTIAIRRGAFPKKTKQVEGCGFSGIGADFISTANGNPETANSNHFANHVRAAAQALNRARHILVSW